MRKRKVLLCYVRLRAPAGALWEYTGLFYLAGALERNAYAPYVFHGSWMELRAAVREIEPEVVGFSCDAENQHFLQGLIPAVKRECLERQGAAPCVVVGGPQSCALGEAFLAATGADYILRGEGDDTLPALLDCLFTQGGAAGALRAIPGLAWRDAAGAFHETPGVGMVADLDTLPRPAYHTSLHKRGYGRVIFSGRGCPFGCAFCASHVGHRSYRLRRMDDVLAEIRENLDRNPDIRYIMMQDDTFCTDPARVRAFCAGMRGIRKTRPVVWFCETHVQTLLRDPPLLREMIDSGLVRLQIGMESGDPEVLRLYNKNITPSQVLHLTELAVELGLPQIAGNFIVGGPREREGLTEDFIRRLLRVGAGVVDLNTGFLRNYPFTAISRNPAAFGLTVTAEDDRTAGDDYPGVVPAGASEEAVVALRQRLNRAIREEMGRCIEGKQIPLERVMAQYRLREEYGIASRWTLELSARGHIHEYYRTLYLGEGQPFDPEAPPEALYPQRTFEYYRGILHTGGIARLFGTVLSPLEADILYRCAGKRSVSEIAADLWGKYREGYPALSGLQTAVMRFLETADKRYWVTVFRFS